MLFIINFHSIFPYLRLRYSLQGVVWPRINKKLTFSHMIFLPIRMDKFFGKVESGRKFMSFLAARAPMFISAVIRDNCIVFQIDLDHPTLSRRLGGRSDAGLLHAAGEVAIVQYSH